MGAYGKSSKTERVLVMGAALTALMFSPAALYAGGPDKGHDDSKVYKKEKMDKAAEEAQKLTPAAGEKTKEVQTDAEKKIYDQDDDDTDLRHEDSKPKF